eukprot:jgi/Hompol1/1715/HPOL_000254-RA
MLDLNNLGYSSPQTVLFQRLTVIITEAVFFLGIARLLQTMSVQPRQFTLLLAVTFLNPGILFVDHIHFQYNAFMYGIQLFSISCMFEGKHIFGGILFAIVLNFKHIYLYQAPAYFVLSRLFPFKRGLCHAYWAPNFWALYSFADRALIQASGIFGTQITTETQSLTRGLVGDSRFTPILFKLWFEPTPKKFLDAVILCGFGSYMFGWHVHEKAILMVLIPLSVVAANSHNHFRTFAVVAASGYFSLMPLLFEPQELPTKALILCIYCIVAIQLVG